MPRRRRLDQLGLRQEPGADPNPGAAVAHAFLDRLERLLGDRRFNWAQATIEGIQQSVSERGLVTPGQRKAIDNIEESQEEGGEEKRRGIRTVGGVYRSIKAPGGRLYKELAAQVEKQTREGEGEFD